MALLQVENLCVEFPVSGGTVKALDNFSLRVEAGAYHGIFGDSGSGKSIAMLAIMDLLRNSASVTADQLSLKGNDILTISTKEQRQSLYQAVSIIFQEPENSLNPCYRIARQLDETLKIHGYTSRKERKLRRAELLADVGLQQIDAILDSYPHQLTSGILQRIMIANALASDPMLLIADEPTTSLDLSEQQKIMKLLNDLVKSRNMAMVLISHDLELLKQQTDFVTVMYCGQVIESGPSALIFDNPKHPYTEAILNSAPSNWNLAPKSSVPSLAGSTPSLHHLPVGCYLGPRCPYAEAKCVQAPHAWFDGSRLVRCHFPIGGRDD